MPDTYYQYLSIDDLRYALTVAQDNCGRRAFLLEKDIWVVAVLEVLFAAPFAKHLIFKGGTTLSKVWHAIRRFSEDIDITYDIRAFAPTIVADAGDDALPPTRSQAKRWSRDIRALLGEWVQNQARQFVDDELARRGFAASVRAQEDHLLIGYEPLFEETGFVRPEVKIEFGARSTGEPHSVRPVVCDAADCLPELTFPSARPTVLWVERTFWEKATAIHVYCRQQRRRGERLSRHWYDLAQLDVVGIASRALDNRALAVSVARHKSMFYIENDAFGQRIDYEAAVKGDLQLVPFGDAYASLAEDYARMLEHGMLLDESEPFDSLMQRCREIEARANA